MRDTMEYWCILWLSRDAKQMKTDEKRRRMLMHQFEKILGSPEPHVCG